MNTQLKLTKEVFKIDTQQWCSEIEIAAQIGISEQSVKQIREVVRLSENTRNHELAPVLW